MQNAFRVTKLNDFLRFRQVTQTEKVAMSRKWLVGYHTPLRGSHSAYINITRLQIKQNVERPVSTPDLLVTFQDSFLSFHSVQLDTSNLVKKLTTASTYQNMDYSTMHSGQGHMILLKDFHTTLYFRTNEKYRSTVSQIWNRLGMLRA